MQKQTIITQNWWHSSKKNVPVAHQETLEEEGIRRALEMMQEGYTSGELNYSGFFEVGSKVQVYHGHWEITTITPDDEKTISIKWSTVDVKERAKELRKRISQKDAETILDNIERKHDASIGVNWDVIDAHIDLFINDKKHRK